MPCKFLASKMNSFCWSLKDDRRDFISLRPASLMHKNPRRRKIIHEMRPVERKERSINLKMIFWYNILFVGFLWLLFKDAYLF